MSNPGKPWRFEQDTKGFDELVVANWLHIERMDGNTWWMRIGQEVFWIKIDKEGAVDIRHTETRDEGTTYPKTKYSDDRDKK